MASSSNNDYLIIPFVQFLQTLLSETLARNLSIYFGKVSQLKFRHLLFPVWWPGWNCFLISFSGCSGQPTLMWTMGIALQASPHQTLLVTQDRQSLVLTSCMNITLHTHGPAIKPPQRIKITVTLDPLTDTQDLGSSNESRRAGFRESKNPTFVYFMSITPSPGSAPEHSCEVLDADVNSQWNRPIEVVRTPLRVSMSAEIQNDEPAPSSGFCATCYVLSPSAPTTQMLEIPFSQCRPGNGTCEGKVQFAVNNKLVL